MKVRIQSSQFTVAEHLSEFIEKKMQKLEQFFDRIIDAEVYLSLDGNNRVVRDKTVKVKVNLPGNQVVAIETDKLFEPAIDAAVESIRRQIKRYKGRIRP